MTLKRIGAGNRMTDAIVHGDKVYLSGYVAEKAVGGTVAEQTADILAQIDETLAQAGSDTDIRQGFDQLRRSYPERREFRFHPLPVSGLSDATRQWLHLLGFGQFG